MDRIVEHNRYGRGTVLQTRHGGYELLVRFRDGVGRWVRFNEVRDVADVAVPIAHERAGPPLARTDEAFIARRMIEAFRLGVVPFDCLSDFTFGRDFEIRSVSAWLRNGAEGVLLLIGDYGVGKTHLLHHIYGQAMEQGYAVAFADSDPAEAPFYRPKRLYNRIVHSIRFRDPVTGVTQSFRVLMRKYLARAGASDHMFFKHLVKADEDELIWEWIEADESTPRPVQWVSNSWGYSENRYGYLPGLYEYAKAANLYCYLLSGISWAAANALELNGLVILLDESESVTIADSSYHRQQGYNFVRGLVGLANNWRVLAGSPESTGLSFCRVGPRVPFAYRLPTRLKIVFALTPGCERVLPNEAAAAKKIALGALSGQVLEDVFSRIESVYRQAYNFAGTRSPSMHTLQRLHSRIGSTRGFVKASVEAFDIVRLNSASKQ